MQKKELVPFYKKKVKNSQRPKYQSQIYKYLTITMSNYEYFRFGYGFLFMTTKYEWQKFREIKLHKN